MSVDAYKIAVKISLVENVTRGLMMMSRHFKTTDAEAKLLEARLKSIGKMVAVGGVLAGAGAFGLSLFKKPIEEAMEYERRLGSLRQMGLGDAQIADARKFVQATNIIGESINDRMRLFVDAQGSFRQSGMGGAQSLNAAKMMTPILGTYEAATKMLDGDKRGSAEMGMRSLNKTIEILGGLTDGNRAKAIADGVFKATQSSGGMVDERQLKQFVAYGSSATNQINLRTIFGGLEPLIGELGGSTAAVGMRTAYTRTNGMMSLPPKRMVAEMGRLHMLKAGTKQQTDDLARLQATDPIAYTQEMMRRYASAGITSRTDIERENAIVYGTNGSKIYNKLMSQMPVIQESLKSYDKSQGASQVVDTPENRMLKARMDLEAKEADMLLKIGQIVLPTFIKMLEKMRDTLAVINAFAENHPAAFKAIVATFAALSVLALASGTILLVSAGMKTLGLVLFSLGPRNIGLIGYAARGLMMLSKGVWALLFTIGPKSIGIIGYAARGLMLLSQGVWALMFSIGPRSIGLIGYLARGIKLLGLALIENPIGILIAAIALAAYELWKHWDVIGPKLASLWASITSGVYSMINSVIGLLNHLPGVHIGKLSDGSSPYVAPSRQDWSQAAHVYIDGKKAGHILAPHITKAQTNSATRPSTSGNQYNSGMGPLRSGSGGN